MKLDGEKPDRGDSVVNNLFHRAFGMCYKNGAYVIIENKSFQAQILGYSIMCGERR